MVAAGEAAAAEEAGWEAVLGHFAAYRSAPCTAARLGQPRYPKTFLSHRVLEFADDSLSRLNPGWDATLHVFQLRPAVVQALNRRLERYALRMERRSKGLQVSNVGGFHSRQNFFASKRWGRKRAIQYLKKAAEAAAKCAEREEFGEASGDAVENSWVNVNRRGHSNGLHSHAGNTWSGVYYVASTGRKKDASPWSGRLVFRTSCGGFGARAWAGGEDEVLATDPENKVGWAKYVEVDPVPGLMVLFPSWLLHCVLPFEPAAADDHYRISVAFNIGREEEGPEEGAPG